MAIPRRRDPHPGSCDACDNGPAFHNARTPHGDGSFCCDCAHCADPGECVQDWKDRIEPDWDAMRDARDDR